MVFTTRTKARLALALVEQLLPLVKQIAEDDKVITDLFLTLADNQVFESLPGAGKRLALDPTGNLGAGVLPAQTCRGQESQHGG
jgi:hypothetical protein